MKTMKTMNLLLLFPICIFGVNIAYCANYLLNGYQESEISFTLHQKVEPSSNINTLTLRYIKPFSYESPTFTQNISKLDYQFEPLPDSSRITKDERGNTMLEVTWNEPRSTINTSISLIARNNVYLDTLKTNSGFPPKNLDSDILKYLGSTKMVDCNAPRISAEAEELVKGATTQYEAVQCILDWVIDHMRYILNPPDYSAGYSFDTGRGNCQNYSHLAAALLRAVQIPVRIVNGICLEEPYEIQLGAGTITKRMAQGHHSWIEIYFPDLGWVPFDPQGSEFFVSNRFIRFEVGIDNEETCKDGQLEWTYYRGTTGQPSRAENLQTQFQSDRIKIFGKVTQTGPKGIFVGPEIYSGYLALTIPELPEEELFAPPPEELFAPPPEELFALPPEELFAPPEELFAPPEEELFALPVETEGIIPDTGALTDNVSDRRTVLGNLEFPENIDIFSSYGPAVESADGKMQVNRNFVVETSEYVTSNGTQYSQTFILSRPMQLETVSLALRSFNRDGQLWVDLLKDDQGKPGEFILTSEIVDCESIAGRVGYSWVDFDASADKAILAPGRYWLTLEFTGGPIVNWFFSYGKPVGPDDGTRYKTMFDDTWSRSLDFEFNYRIAGLTVD